ncbi:MAG: C4-type zinc ribbon domain-containing protein, partial [Actinomycetota bacterium]
ESVEELARLAGERDGLAAERATAAAAVPAEVLALYEDLRSHKQGIGAAALVDGVCQACHEGLSAMELDRLKKSADVKRCEHCRRILVLA